MAIKAAILDTSAIVAFLSSKDRFHLWAVAAFKRLPPLLLTCESVLSETFYLLQDNPKGIQVTTNMIRKKLIKVFSCGEELERAMELMLKYSNVPMSFADACLVCMIERLPEASIVTIDSDFKHYRMNRNQRIPLTIPD